MENNAGVLKKILKVNSEIKKELLIEDHEKNLKAINEFKIQQK